jgi:hypothetical protein
MFMGGDLRGDLMGDLGGGVMPKVQTLERSF